MTDPKRYMKWFSRVVFMLLATTMAYVVFQPAYNFAHWVPHAFLRGLGTPYSALLTFEQNADKLLHPLGAFVLTISLIYSEIPLFHNRNAVVFQIILMAIVIAEVVQWNIGRGFETADLVLGALGSYGAYLLAR